MKISNIQSIELMFENLDSIKITNDNFKNLEIIEPETKSEYSNECESFTIDLDLDFCQNKIKSFDPSNVAVTLYQRLTSQEDLNRISINTDKHSITYFLPFLSSNSINNAYQQFFISEDKKYISIKITRQ